MSEASFEIVARELRAAAPPAPEALRELLRGLPQPADRPAFRLKPGLAAAAAIAIAIGLGAATIGSLRSSPRSTVGSAVAERATPEASSRQRSSRLDAGPSMPYNSFSPARKLSPLIPGSRLQRYNVTMRTRVDDLSEATKSAVRTTRRLGGYVAAADYATEQRTGDSRLDLGDRALHRARHDPLAADLGRRPASDGRPLRAAPVDDSPQDRPSRGEAAQCWADARGAEAARGREAHGYEALRSPREPGPRGHVRHDLAHVDDAEAGRKTDGTRPVRQLLG